MIRDLSEEGLQAKQEGSIGAAKAIKEASAASSRLWLGLKDPRIVRVSRTLGGKDRHSKVRTARGLRDRRVRLSVPTAILLYDLQERLGLSQPSKVVDWLLDAARHEIDKLPPLHFPPGIGFDQSPSSPHEMNSSRPPTAFDEDQQYWTLGQTMRSRRIDQNDHDGARQVDVPNSVMYMAPSYHLDPCHVGTSNLGGNPMSPNHEPVHDYRPAMVPSSLSLMPSPQLMLCPSGTLMPSIIQSYAAATAGYDLKCIGHYHMEAASSQNPPPVSLQPVISTMVFPAELLQRESPFPNAPQK